MRRCISHCSIHLLKDLHNHIEHESNEDIPRLEEILSQEESAALAPSFGLTKVVNHDNKESSKHSNKPYSKTLPRSSGLRYAKLQILSRHLDESKL